MSERSQELLALLRSKNRCLTRFLELTEEFWGSAKDGDLEGLSVFESRRDSTLRSIELFDRKIDETSAGLAIQERDPALAAEARELIEEREALVHRILGLDLKIIEKIEEERERLRKELAAARKGQESLSKFKSAWLSEAGEEIDRTL